MSEKISIRVTADGPIHIQNAGSATYCGQALETDGDMWICRCGRSSNAPFCDGTHRKVGFDGADGTGDRAEVRVWEGRTVRTFFNPNACMHAFYCKPMKELRQRELEGDDAAAEEIVRVVSSCPSGALTSESRTVEVGPADSGVDVEIMEGGEVRICREFEIDRDLPAKAPGDRPHL